MLALHHHHQIADFVDMLGVWKGALWSGVCLLLAALCSAESSTMMSASSDESERLLAQARNRLERYEDAILHGFLARNALDAPSAQCDAEIAFLFQSLRFAPSQRGDEQAEWTIAQSEATRNFTSFPPYPPALTYVLPPVLQQAGEHQADNATNLLEFYRTVLPPPAVVTLPHSITLSGLFDTALLQAISNRVLIATDVAWAKFLAQPEQFCHAIHANDITHIRSMLTNQVQVTTVLDRVSAKTNAWTTSKPSSSSTPTNPATARMRTTILTLFQTYLIPITTQLEVQTIVSYAAHCPLPARK